VPALLAIAREVADSLVACELTHLERQPIDIARARHQHRRYLEALAGLGCEVRCLPQDPQHPDSVFVEDTAVVLDDIAIITRPGAASRRGESAAVAEALRPHRELIYLPDSMTLDGGDVLRVGDEIYVGLSSRTAGAAVQWMREILVPRGMQVRGVHLAGCLHLKSAACLVAEHTLLLNPAWVDPVVFAGLDHLAVDPAEPFGANAVLLGGKVLHGEAFFRTRARLVAAGITVISVPADELAKAEGGVSCCSLLVT
jgi:dimethylargininase